MTDRLAREYLDVVVASAGALAGLLAHLDDVDEVADIDDVHASTWEDVAGVDPRAEYDADHTVDDARADLVDMVREGRLEVRGEYVDPDDTPDDPDPRGMWVPARGVYLTGVDILESFGGPSSGLTFHLDGSGDVVACVAWCAWWSDTVTRRLPDDVAERLADVHDIAGWVDLVAAGVLS